MKFNSFAQASTLAPPHVSALPQPDRPLYSGLDAVLCLRLDDLAIAIKRALGRRIDPSTSRIYHLEFDPPPTDQPGIMERLETVTDDSNDEQHLQHRLTDFDAVMAPLDEWLSRFVKLKRPLDGSRFIGDVLRSCTDVADSILRAKAAAGAARSAAEAAHAAKVRYRHNRALLDPLSNPDSCLVRQSLLLPAHSTSFWLGDWKGMMRDSMHPRYNAVSSAGRLPSAYIL